MSHDWHVKGDAALSAHGRVELGKLDCAAAALHGARRYACVKDKPDFNGSSEYSLAWSWSRMEAGHSLELDAWLRGLGMRSDRTDRYLMHRNGYF